MRHDWRALMQYTLTDDEARKMVQGYGHPEVDNAPITLLATDQRPAVGDPRVFLGTHNLLREESMVVCYRCENAWSPELAARECRGEADSPLGPRPDPATAHLGNISATLGAVGRNDPCPCGSGQKFKRCHGAN